MSGSDRRAARELILRALGLAAGAASFGASCGGEVERATGGGGSGGDGSTTASSAATADAASTTTGFGSASSSTGNNMTVCGTYVLSSADVPAEGPCSGYEIADLVCYPKRTPNEPCETTYDAGCFLAAYSCGWQSYGSAVCPAEPSNECCAIVVGNCPVGRPFVVRGRARVAKLEEGGGWVGDDLGLPNMSDLDDEARTTLAAFWAAEAQAEHASIASFSRFVLQLLALGAPSDLVEGATRAIADEHEHARVAFGLAAAYGKRSLRPAALDIEGAVPATTDWASVASAVASEGCIAETISALQVRAAADIATDPAVRRALRVIADQEMDHALLAWRTLKWLLAQGGEPTGSAVSAVFADAPAHVGLGPTPASTRAERRLREHGYLPLDERRELALSALTDVVMPTAAALGSPGAKFARVTERIRKQCSPGLRARSRLPA